MLFSTDQAGAVGHALFDAFASLTDLGRALPPNAQGRLSWVLQKLVHVALFGGIGVIAGRRSTAEERLLWLGATVVIAVLTEALQLTTNSRSAELRDVLLNIAASCAGYRLARKKQYRICNLV
jgi:VanZ family protein